jgi:aspartate-semialdehyde dehydrogenase
MKVAVIGSTGLVGQKMIKVLEERKFPVTEFFPVASIKSIGKEILFNKKKYSVMSMEDAIAKKPDIAIFSAGSAASLKYAPVFAEQGTFVIDNSSAWRMFPDKKLIIPEVNAKVLTKDDKIIANPNCSTIQLVLAIAPLHRRYKIKRMVISTYQSVTGTGQKAVEQLMNERKGIKSEKIYPYPIDMNCFPHGGTFTDNGYTTEELKLSDETRKILGDNSIKVTATVVRIPVIGGHSEAVNIEFEDDFTIEEVFELLHNSPGIVVQDNVQENLYPMPLMAHEKDDVFVGRIRRDLSQKNSLNMWIVADNLRKGAATNAIQIAETLIEKKFV